MYVRFAFSQMENHLFGRINDRVVHIKLNRYGDFAFGVKFGSTVKFELGEPELERFC